MRDNIGGNFNSAFGSDSLMNGGQQNCAFGRTTLRNNTGNYNNAFGLAALLNNTIGSSNSAFGHDSLVTSTTGSNNCAFGISAMYYNTGSFNSAFGVNAVRGNGGNGSNNTGVGVGALYFISTGSFNTACGSGALQYTTVGGGHDTFSNCTGLGNDARVSASNQVQIGNAATTTYIYGAINNRSDMRDKADIRNTVLGLEFIEKLRPVDYRWDMRDDYLVQCTKIERIDIDTQPLPDLPQPDTPGTLDPIPED
jgi:hypothetical protein